MVRSRELKLKLKSSRTSMCVSHCPWARCNY